MTLDIATHKNILLSILKDIFTNSQVAPYLGFKGGTAALFFYGLERFSVDLDFDLLDSRHEQEVFNQVNIILQRYGNVKIQNKRYSLFFLLSYIDKIDGAQNVKVDINKRLFGSNYEVKSYLGVAMQVMVKADMIAHKLVAMHERIGKTNRDIFDVWFFLKQNSLINKKIIELRTNMSYRDFLLVCIHDLEKMNNRGILSGIGELLTPQQKNWVKQNLLTDTIFLLRLAQNQA